MTLSHVHIAIHLALVFALPPLSLGVINKTKALFAGRVGPPLFQPYYELAKLFRKGTVLSRTTTWVFLAGPAVGLVTTILTALLIPLGGQAAPLAFDGDFVVFAYVLGLGRFFTIAAALDTGSSFEGMGGAREATFSALAEPALLLALLVLVMLRGSFTLSGLVAGASPVEWATVIAPVALAVLSLFVVLLAENSRIPFDDPATHLELTMVHEVMLLDHSGPLLGVALWGAAQKLFVQGALLVRILVPLPDSSAALRWAVFFAAMLALGVLIGLVESTMARLRLRQIPMLLTEASLLSAFGIVLLVR
jgi:formate hydrogenlyase subunit 4